MQSLNPTRNVQRRGRELLTIGALVIMAGIILGGLGFLIMLLFSSNFFGGLVIFAGFVVAVVGIGVMIRGMTLRTENEIALAVDAMLKTVLDDRYTLIRNISGRGLGYIDAVLVGPPGALAMRITDIPGIFQNEGADWLERKGGKPFMLSNHDFTDECRNDVYALRDYLAKRQLPHVPVYGLVVFTSPNVQLSLRQPTVPVADIRTLLTVLRSDFLREDRTDATSVQAVVNALYH